MHTIIIDTREQTPLDFSFYNVETCVATVKAGDYTLQGLEEFIFIERKASSGELYGNLVKNFARFTRELEKAKDCKYKYIICEFGQEVILTFPKNSGIPYYLHKSLRSAGGFFRKRIHEVEELGFVFVYCGDPETAARRVVEIFKEIEQNEEIRHKD